MSASINPIRVTSFTSPRTKCNDKVIETSRDSEAQSPHGIVVKYLTEIPKVASSIPEGDKKAHNYACFASSALCTRNYDLYDGEVFFC